MSIKRPPPAPLKDLREFMRRVQLAIIHLQKVQKHQEDIIGDLSTEAINNFCPHQVGEVIPLLPQHTPAGKEMLMHYTSFLVERVFPDILWKEKTLRWKYTGQFSNAEEEETGVIYADDIDPDMKYTVPDQTKKIK